MKGGTAPFRDDETPAPLSAVESRPSVQRVRQDLAIYVSAYVVTLVALFVLIWWRNNG